MVNVNVILAVVLLHCTGCNGSSSILLETSMPSPSESHGAGTPVLYTTTTGIQASLFGITTISISQTQHVDYSSSAFPSVTDSVLSSRNSLFQSALEDISDSQNTMDAPNNRSDFNSLQQSVTISDEYITVELTQSLHSQSTASEEAAVTERSVATGFIYISTGSASSSHHMESTRTSNIYHHSAFTSEHQISSTVLYDTVNSIDKSSDTIQIVPTLEHSSAFVSSSSLQSLNQTALETSTASAFRLSSFMQSSEIASEVSSSIQSSNMPQSSMLASSQYEKLDLEVTKYTFVTPTQTFAPIMTSSFGNTETSNPQAIAKETIIPSSTSTTKTSLSRMFSETAFQSTAFPDVVGIGTDEENSTIPLLDIYNTTPVSNSGPINSSDDRESVTTNKMRGGITLRVLLEGNCALLEEYQILYFDFSRKLLELIQEKFSISASQLALTELKCNPMIVNVRCDKLSRPNVNLLLANLGHLTNEFISVRHENSILYFNVTSVNAVAEKRKDVRDIGYMNTKLETADYAIISAAIFLFAMLVTMGLIVVCRECYTKSRGKTFTLKDIPHVNIKMADFSLIKIPRPKVSYCDNVRKEVKSKVNSLYNAQTSNETVCYNGNNDAVKRRLPTTVDPKDMRVRMSAHEDGIVVGITSYSRPPSPQVENPHNKSSEKLIRNSASSSTDGVTNLGYIDDDKFDEKGEVKSELELML